MIQELLPQAERIAAKLKVRGETISVAESLPGLVSAALLAIGGASAYFMGGAVVYTRSSRTELLRVTEAELTGTPCPPTPGLCSLVRSQDQGAAGDQLGDRRDRNGGTDRQPLRACARPFLHRGDRPNGERSLTVETGNSDRVDNMRVFSIAALDLLEKSLG